MRRASILLAAAALTAGCSANVRPYRFASPLIGGAELPGSARHGDAPQPPTTRATAAAPRADGRAPIVATRPSAPTRRALDGRRSWVGVRDERDPVAAVLARCRERAPSCPSELPGRERWLPPETPISPGDLLLFERVGRDNRERLVALVERQDARGVFELAYLAAGVWRRGFIDPTRPRVRRDRAGRVVNTFLRHARARPPKGTRFLAGELLVGVLPIPVDPKAAPQLAARERR
ncbi:MAG: hypothetical protein R3B48_02700 [Kofleriaceae bacterium]